MAGLGELFLAGLLLKALSGSSASSSPPAPPPVPDQAGGGKDNTATDIAGVAGGAAGTVLTAILGAGGGTAGAGGGTTGTLVTAGAATGGTAGAGSTGAATTSTTVGGAFATSITAGGVFATAWLAIFILQFVVINIVNNLRTVWLRYRDKVTGFNRPLLHLQKYEIVLIDATLRELGLRNPGTVNGNTRMDGSYAEDPPGVWNDPRLDAYSRHTTGFNQEMISHPRWRQVMANPFPPSADRRRPALHIEQWTFLQHAARLVAARYCFEASKFASGMLARFPGLGAIGDGSPPSGITSEIWSYPLLGGGQPTATYHEIAELMRAAGTAAGYTIDDILNASRLAAMLHVASCISMDPGINVPWDPARYSRELYQSFGLSPATHGVTLDGQRWLIDPVLYKLPCTAAWLDIDELKRGLALQPFVPGTSTPTPHGVTALRVMK